MIIELGTAVIFDGAKATGATLHRRYGIVRTATAERVTVETSDGGLSVHLCTNVAVYRTLPPNWPQLFESGEVLRPRAVAL